MLSNKQQAHRAGLLYLILVITGVFSLMYVPGLLYDFEHADTTYLQIKEHQFLFRFSIITTIIAYVAFLFLGLTLYYLLKPIHAKIAMYMLILVVVSIPLSLIPLQHKFAILTLIENANNSPGIPDQIMWHLEQFNYGNTLASVFWGLWLLPFGYLVIKSSMFPKIFGYLLMIGCFGYLINFIGNVVFEHYESLGISGFISIPASAGEIGICLWMLLMGAKNNKVTETSV